MVKSDQPFARDLVLVGGGHSHALMLRMLGMDPLRGVRITLVSDVSHAPYSGMLPGLIAGIYTYDEAHIDLRKLCEFARVRFVESEAVGLDLGQRRVLLRDRPALGFDAVSVNIGSTPWMETVPGAVEHATPSKPVPVLLERWEALVAEAESRERPTHVVLVGGGAGGTELALCMQQRLGDKGKVTLVHKGAEILETHNAGVREKFVQLLGERGIAIATGETVVEVAADQVVCASGKTIDADQTFWVTNASPPTWLEEAGLKTDERGFVLVSPTLQSLSHPGVFAAGDVATIEGAPRPKSGVFAVRMAKPLTENLRRHFSDEPLIPYRPQKEFLSLIGTATRSAVASRKFLSWKSPLMWRLKDWIDRKFMAKFEDFPEMDGEEDGHGLPESTSDNLPDQLADLRRRANMRCLGCAAKVGGSTLSAALDRLKEEHAGDPVIADLLKPDDAAVFAIPGGRELVQTVDYIPALVEDPFTFGRIATLHCFSDIFAMGADPDSGLATVLLPFASETVTGESLFQLLSGIVYELKTMGAVLRGGHTAEGETLALGLACNGVIDPDQDLRKGGMQPEQDLILTKPIGTGTLFAASMRLEAKGRWLDSALASMLRSNQEPSKIVRQHGATACTDVTGFGLAGHLIEMLRPSGCGVTLDLESIPILDGALETSGQGILSSLQGQNSRAVNAIGNAAEFAEQAKFPLLFDPQTSGGLLASVPRGKSAACIEELREAGFEAAVIGQISGGGDQDSPIDLQ